MERSNTYVFVYSVVMVVIIATALSLAATLLKPAQQRNIKIDKMQNILSAAKIEVADASETENVFQTALKNFGFVERETENLVSPADAGLLDTFNVSVSKDSKYLPLYEFEDKGNSYFVVPLTGKGLWGGISGYISIQKADGNTVVGTVFSHESETAGLGAEIVKEKFRSAFEGKQIFNGNEFTSVKVVKGDREKTINEVDAISGSTKTCDGVSEMLETCLEGYAVYFKSLTKSQAVAEVVVEESATPENEQTESNVESQN